MAFVPASSVPTLGGEAPPHPCVAFAIGRKVGTAVVRNRLRRRLRDELAALGRAGLLAPGAYLIGLAPAAAALDGAALRRHLRTALAVRS